jgi:hypothetical protein
MKKIFLTCLALIVFALPVRASDMGGNPLSYVSKYRSMKKPIHLPSPICASACTMALHFPVCGGNELWFHAPFGTSAVLNQHMKQMIMNWYPSKVRNIIRARGGLTSQKIVIYTKELGIPPCKS